MELNTREIATLIWACIVILTLLVMPGMRKLLLNICRAFKQKTLLKVLALVFIYIGLMIWFLYTICVWDWDQLKNTIIWTFSVALIAVFRSNNIQGEPDYFRKWITENFEILAFVQFLVTLYTYPIWLELLVIPFVTLLGGMIAVGQHDLKTKSTAEFLNKLLGWLALAFFGTAIVLTIMDFWSYATVQTFRDLYTPIVLTILFLPFIFVLYIVMSYETTFIALHFTIKDERLRRSAKWRSVFAFGPNIELLRRWQRHVGMHRPQNKDELKVGFKDVRDAKRRDSVKIEVLPAEGWSPPIAKDFLYDLGFRTRDYHRSFDQEWSAGSSMIEISDGIIPNNMAYYMHGNKNAVTTLKLKLNVNDPENAPSAEARFAELAATLLNSAIGDASPDLGSDDLDVNIGLHRVRVTKTSWQVGKRSGYDRTLEISV